MELLGTNLTELSDQAIFDAFGTELQNTQGYGLVGHGRAYVSLALMRFRNGLDVKNASRVLADWGGVKSSTALELRKTFLAYSEAQLAGNEGAKREAKGRGVIAVALSTTGFQKLNLPQSDKEKAFIDGFRASTDGLPPSALNTPPFDAVVIVASDDNKAQLADLRQKVETDFRPVAAIQWESGGKLAGNVDHFGFAEDIGQPVIFPGPQQRNSSWRSTWNPMAPPKLVLVEVPGHAKEFGSYMAYLKIEQHVDDFNSLVAQTAAATSTPADLVQAWILGRAKSGQPLQPAGATLDDFRYSDMSRCPMAAHIRRVNGRDPNLNLTMNRIVRRGVFYEDNGSRGALFQCFQAKLANGFLTLWSWALDSNFIHPDSGQDPFLGERDWPPTPYNVPAPAGQASVRRLTTVLHGEFFYFPSRPFFLRLGVSP